MQPSVCLGCLGLFFGGMRQFAGAGCVLRSCRKPALCMPPPDPCWRVFFSLQALRLPLGAHAMPAAGALSTTMVGPSAVFYSLHPCLRVQRPSL